MHATVDKVLRVPSNDEQKMVDVRILYKQLMLVQYEYVTTI